MADPIAVGKAQRHYKRHSPLHGASNLHKADMAAIKGATSPILKADTMIAQRRDELLDQGITDMLVEMQGKRSRYRYDQEAVIGLEHLVDGPLDPHTQAHIWRRMLEATKGKTMPKAEFLMGARAILSQTSLYDPPTMAG